MLEELKSARKVVGIKQLRRAMEAAQVKNAYIACDADPRLTEPLIFLCEQSGIPCDCTRTLRQLGTACGIDVGAAAVGILR